MKTLKNLATAALLAGAYLTVPFAAHADSCTDQESSCVYDAGEEYMGCLATCELFGGSGTCSCYHYYIVNWDYCVNQCYSCEGPPYPDTYNCGYY